MTPLRPGDVLELAEEHYRFGVGPLVCRVCEVIEATEIDGLTWWLLSGDCKRATLATIGDYPGGWFRRELYVDARVIPFARRTPRRRSGKRPSGGRP